MDRHPPPRPAPIIVLLALLLPLSCREGGMDPRVEGISREAFISAYVELRVATLRTQEEELPLGERNRILEEHGLAEDDMLSFVEMRGQDVQFMRRLWEEIDSIIAAGRDSGAPDAGPGGPPGREERPG